MPKALHHRLLERARSISSSYSETRMEQIAVASVSSSQQNARLDEDEKRKAVKQVRELKPTLDEAQQAIQMPQLTKAFNEGIKSVTEIVAEVSDADERNKQSHHRRSWPPDACT